MRSGDVKRLEGMPEAGERPILRRFALRGNPLSGNCGCYRTVRLINNVPHDRFAPDVKQVSRRGDGSRNGNERGTVRHVYGQYDLFLL